MNRTRPRQGKRRYEDRRRVAGALLNGVSLSRVQSTLPGGLLPVQRAFARRLTRSLGITAIVGQHVYVVQPIRTIDVKLVVFGERNLISFVHPR